MEPNPISSIHTAFENITDPRTGDNIRHPLINLIAITICGVICGADSWTDIELFGKAKQDFLGTFLDLSNGIPSHDTLGRVFRWLDPDELASSFYQWTQAIRELTAGEIIAIDGKCLRGSKDSTHDKLAIYMVSAWAQHNELVLAEEKVAEKSSEHTAIPHLLTLLDLKDCVVTIDAAGCYTAIAEQIIDQEADYVLAVKGNQGTLLADVQATFDAPQLPPHTDYYRQYDDTHGRKVVRECWVTSFPEIITHINAYKPWSGLRSIVKLVARTGEGDPLTVETRYFITSLPPDARNILRVVRGHWHIENSLHWVLDIAFCEDDSRIRCDHAPENMALLRHMALNLLKHETSLKIGVKARRKRAGWDDAYLLKVLSVEI
jgi:predicted transposase YbfD/YdcC